MRPFSARLTFYYCCFCLEHTPFHFTLVWCSFLRIYAACLVAPLRCHFCLIFLTDPWDLPAHFTSNILIISTLNPFFHITISHLERFSFFFIDLHLTCCPDFDFRVFCSCCHPFQLCGNINFRLLPFKVCFYGVVQAWL